MASLTSVICSSATRTSALFSTCRITVVATQTRGARWTKPYKVGDPKLWALGIMDYSYKYGRNRKIAKIELPDMESHDHANMSVEEMRSFMKEKGIVPHRPWDEKPLVVNCSQEIIERYVPPPQDGKVPLLKSAKDKTLGLASKAWDRPVSKIRDYLPDFNPHVFAKTEALDIYKAAHDLLAKLSTQADVDREEEELFEFVTERCYPEMTHHTKYKTIKWQFVKTLEEPSIAQVKVQKLGLGDTKFAQVTVRFHTQQILAVYDRFGRLMYGSENALKDVLEYVVFENFLTNKYGLWRIHGKIIPEYTARSPIIPTFVKPELKPSSTPEKKVVQEVAKSSDEHGVTPQLATS